MEASQRSRENRKKEGSKPSFFSRNKTWIFLILGVVILFFVLKSPAMSGLRNLLGIPSLTTGRNVNEGDHADTSADDVQVPVITDPGEIVEIDIEGLSPSEVATLAVDIYKIQMEHHGSLMMRAVEGIFNADQSCQTAASTYADRQPKICTRYEYWCITKNFWGTKCNNYGEKCVRWDHNVEVSDQAELAYKACMDRAKVFFELLQKTRPMLESSVVSSKPVSALAVKSSRSTTGQESVSVVVDSAVSQLIAETPGLSSVLTSLRTNMDKYSDMITRSEESKIQASAKITNVDRSTTGLSVFVRTAKLKPDSMNSNEQFVWDEFFHEVAELRIPIPKDLPVEELTADQEIFEAVVNDIKMPGTTQSCIDFLTSINSPSEVVLVPAEGQTPKFRVTGGLRSFTPESFSAVALTKRVFQTAYKGNSHWINPNSEFQIYGIALTTLDSAISGHRHVGYINHARSWSNLEEFDQWLKSSTDSVQVVYNDAGPSLISYT